MSDAMGLTVYLGGPLDDVGRRGFNRAFANHLIGLGYKVILPQDEAEPVIAAMGGSVTEGLSEAIILAIARQNEDLCKRADVGIFILDGEDTGTAFEAAMKLTHCQWQDYGLAIGLSTSFIKREFRGVNGMFALLHAVVWQPDIADNPREAAAAVHQVIQEKWQQGDYEKMRKADALPVVFV